MENLAEVFIRTFTRYFIPGLVFLVIALFLPLYVFGESEVLDNLRLMELPQVLVLSIVLGYLLDSLGAYRWTLCYRRYEQTRTELAKAAMDLDPSIKSNDPDQYLGDLWLLKADIYERLFLERAEWVMILESSCALLIGAAIILVTSVAIALRDSCFKYWHALIITATLTVGSYISSLKGIQRMSAHNVKLLRAIESVIQEKKVDLLQSVTMRRMSSKSLAEEEANEQ